MGDLVGWSAGLDELMGRVAGRFGRVEPRRRARSYVLGLLSSVAGDNSWTLAEAAGDLSPDSVRWLLNGAGWDTTGSATTCAAMSPSTWATPTGC